MFYPTFFTVAVFASLVLSQDQSIEFTSESHGFSVERPDDSWSFKEELDSSDGTLAVQILLTASQGAVQASVRARPLSEETDPAAIRDKTLGQVKGMAGYEIKETKDFDVAGSKAPGFVIEAEAYGKTFLVHQCYLVENGMQYTLACNAPTDEFEKLESVLHGIWGSVEFTPVTDEMKDEFELVKLAGKCGSELEWSATWEEASARAKKDKKLVMVLIHSLPSFKITDKAMLGPFMDPDIVGIVQERFVAFRYEKGMDAPFVSQDSYGMGPSSFGTTILLVTPDGEVVGDTFSTEVTSFHDFLITHLKKNPDFGGHAVPRGLKSTELKRWYLERGDYNRAAKLLESPANAKEHRLRASLLRRLRQGDEALKEIATARKDRKLAPDLLLDEAVVLLRMGRFDSALKAVERYMDKYEDSERTPEAMYWLGCLKQKLKGKASAELVYRLLAATHPENRWAWKAAGVLKSTEFSLGMGERLDWPDNEILAALEFPEFEKLQVNRSRRAEHEAVMFLLERQRDDGSWISPVEVGTYSNERASDFTVAVTAICGKGLLPHLGTKDVRTAVKRAADFILAEREKEKKAEPLEFFMDYTIYNRTYVLWFLTGCIDSGLFKRKELKPVLAEIIEDIGRRQKPGGGWSYYITTDLKNADKPTNQSISFVTAAALVSLLEARDKGIDVPSKILNRGLDCLNRMRNLDGTFEYFLFHEHEDAPRNTPAPGAAGRGPLCAYTLYRGGKWNLEGIQKTLDIFMEHRDTYAKEHGKTLMHAGLHAQGSHYLMFDYAYAAAAIALMPEEDRKKYKIALLEQMLGARSVDASYVDNPLNGWHYGTGMALMAFHSLQPLP